MADKPAPTPPPNPENKHFGAIREHTDFYILHSFKVRPEWLGSIEDHPDFE